MKALTWRARDMLGRVYARLEVSGFENEGIPKQIVVVNQQRMYLSRRCLYSLPYGMTTAGRPSLESTSSWTAETYSI